MDLAYNQHVIVRLQESQHALDARLRATRHSSDTVTGTPAFYTLASQRLDVRFVEVKIL